MGSAPGGQRASSQGAQAGRVLSSNVICLTGELTPRAHGIAGRRRGGPGGAALAPNRRSGDPQPEPPHPQAPTPKLLVRPIIGMENGACLLASS